MRDSLSVTLVSAGCFASGCRGLAASTALVDHSQWSQVDAEGDPFGDRPAEVDCPSSTWVVEVDAEVIASA